MSLVEARSWMAYIYKNGSLNLGLRLELGIAQLRATFAQVMGAKVEVADFLPRRDATEEPAATVQDVFNLLQSVKSGKG